MHFIRFRSIQLLELLVMARVYSGTSIFPRHHCSCGHSPVENLASLSATLSLPFSCLSHLSPSYLFLSCTLRFEIGTGCGMFAQRKWPPVSVLSKFSSDPEVAHRARQSGIIVTQYLKASGAASAFPEITGDMYV